MNDVFIDVDYAQIYKHGQKIGGGCIPLVQAGCLSPDRLYPQ